MSPKKSELGRAIIKNKLRNGTSSYAYSSARVDNNLQSITQENDLDAFIREAEMAETDFTTDRSLQIVNASQTGIPTKEELSKTIQKINSNIHLIKVPRRPAWNKQTSPEELDRMERSSFLDWRRSLAMLEEKEGFLFTPYERNIEVWRQLWRTLERSDLCVQIVDARDPLFFRCIDLEKYIKELKKKGMLLVNKADFLDLYQRQKWTEWFNANGIQFSFFSAKVANEDLEKLSTEEIEQLDSIDHDLQLNSPDVLNPNQILNLFKKIGLSDSPEKSSITVGLIGYPNVGKSSTINSILARKKVTVSSTPGKTKHFQTIIISPEVTLCDCPGLVFPSFVTTKAEMIVKGVLPVDQLRLHIPPVQLVCDRIPRFFLEWMYGINLSKNAENDNGISASALLSAYALIRGFRTSGQGNPDEPRAARIILKDYINGELLYCHGPPSEDSVFYSSRVYEEGGIKYEIAQRAKEHHHIISAKLAEEPLQDDILMDMESPNHVQALLSGTDKTFSRVALFPHQSGYNAVVDTGKKHKQKKRQKDRSWRAK